MKVVFYLNIVSPHQLPLAREVAKRVGVDDFLYIYAEDFHAERASMGWSNETEGVRVAKLNDGNRQILEDADLLYTGIRCLALLERRAARGLKSYYYSERWFKPMEIGVGGGCRCAVDGRIRMLVPGYRKMAKGFVKWLNEDPNARYLAVGPWAKKDMLCIGVRDEKIVDWGYFVEPSDSSPHSNTQTLNHPNNSLRVLYVGRLIPLKRVDTIIRAVALANVQLKSKVEVEERTGLSSICGVDPCRDGENVDGRAASMRPPRRDETGALIERALPESNNHSSTSTSAFDSLYTSSPLHGYTLTIVGDGSEKARLQKLAEKAEAESRSRRADGSNIHSSTSTSNFNFLQSVPIREVRAILRAHDVLVFASNALDGWGAVVNEALAEGTPVIGTYETGASAALLPDSQLFHCGDYRELARKLIALHLHLSPIPLSSIPPAYTPAGAAERLLV